ncbi:MAG: serine/threonine-protein kinase [Bryobacteraceae bacterium]
MDEVLVGRYEILQEIGRGGMGRVVKARDLSLLRLVAIKVVRADNDPTFVSRLSREAQATALLSHPNIVNIYDVGQVDGAAFIVMEYLAGDTLETRMHYVPQDEWGRFLPMLGLCADALDYAHRKGIVHRDVKPSNIMITSEAVPKLLDFGIARVTASLGTQITQTGAFMGTPSHMAPEQIQGVNVGPRADQYSLAVTAFTLLTGRLPFPAADVISLIAQILHNAPPVPSSLNPALPRKVDQVLLKALDKDPANRFGSCLELFEALERATSETSAKRWPDIWERLKTALSKLLPGEEEAATPQTSPTAIDPATTELGTGKANGQARRWNCLRHPRHLRNLRRLDFRNPRLLYRRLHPGEWRLLRSAWSRLKWLRRRMANSLDCFKPTRKEPFFLIRRRHHRNPLHGPKHRHRPRATSTASSAHRLRRPHRRVRVSSRRCSVERNRR